MFLLRKIVDIIQRNDRVIEENYYVEVEYPGGNLIMMLKSVYLKLKFGGDKDVELSDDDYKIR